MIYELKHIIIPFNFSLYLTFLFSYKCFFLIFYEFNYFFLN